MTGAGPLVSIVTPTLNQGRYIERTIESIRAQTYTRLEHIVVDGGSSDETLDVLRRYEGTYDLRWTSGQDSGMYQAINRGFALAKGDILAYLNSDDLYLPWSVETAVRGLEQAGAPELVYGDALLLDEETGRLRPHFQPPFRRAYLHSIGSFAQPATWWRRELLDRVGGFDEELRFTADLDFYLRAADAGRIVRIREFLAVMRLHPAMSTVTQATRIRDENQRTRARRGGAAKPITVLERMRAWAARRQAWLALTRSAASAAGRARAAGGDGSEGPWPRFVARGVRIRPLWVVLGLLPGLGNRFQWGAIEAPWVAEVAG